ncbi:unnamed protein product [Spirodela intermedia]|uniref:X8 domain-containing protein n=1 Tax=Spirodela intermedia TaxID=51605 RepID=A0A7I8II89_SPIIN|nr:unnamed protein product [Spirodela intermedia]CAA6657593.1 unnamed protein product [Spirodela intermedia]
MSHCCGTDEPDAGASEEEAGGLVHAEAGVTEQQLQGNLDYACGQPPVDCAPIQPGGACYNPNTVASHAGYAMNLLYQVSGKNPGSCNYEQTATVTTTDPSAPSSPVRRWLGWLPFVVDLLRPAAFLILIWCSFVSSFLLW